MSLAARMERRIKEALGTETRAEILIDDNGCGARAHIIVVSDRFEDLPKLERHRIVQACILSEIKSELHALFITARTHREMNSYLAFGRLTRQKMHQID